MKHFLLILAMLLTSVSYGQLKPSGTITYAVLHDSKESEYITTDTICVKIVYKKCNECEQEITYGYQVITTEPSKQYSMDSDTVGSITKTTINFLYDNYISMFKDNQNFYSPHILLSYPVRTIQKNNNLK